MDGAVVVGYPGIGKSTLANNPNYNKFIDLESSNFFVNGVRQSNWYIPYCKIALDIAKQGFIVFTSSHPGICTTLFKLSDKKVPLLTVSPCITLKDLWIRKLSDRYSKSKKPKDQRSYMRARTSFDEDVHSLQSEEGFVSVIIPSMKYDLIGLIYEGISCF